MEIGNAANGAVGLGVACAVGAATGCAGVGVGVDAFELDACAFALAMAFDTLDEVDAPAGANPNMDAATRQIPLTPRPAEVRRFRLIFVAPSV
jgi:hypothetical protein